MRRTTYDERRRHTKPMRGGKGPCATRGWTDRAHFYSLHGLWHSTVVIAG